MQSTFSDSVRERGDVPNPIRQSPRRAFTPEGRRVSSATSAAGSAGAEWGGPGRNATGPVSRPRRSQSGCYAVERALTPARPRIHQRLVTLLGNAEMCLTPYANHLDVFLRRRGGGCQAFVYAVRRWRSGATRGHRRRLPIARGTWPRPPRSTRSSNRVATWNACDAGTTTPLWPSAPRMCFD